MGNPLSSAEANALIAMLLVYLDDGSGAFDPGSDAVVATIETLSLTSGIQTVDLTGAAGNPPVSFSSPNRYFVVVEVEADAHLSTPRRFRVTHGGDLGSAGMYAGLDRDLRLEYSALVSSRAVTAISHPQPDGDGDGMPDAWEMEFFGDPASAHPDADTDHDGIVNRYEYIADTHPTNGLSHFSISEISYEGCAAVHFDSSTRRRYTLQYTDTPERGESWRSVPEQTDRGGRGTDDALEDDSVSRARSYRILVEVP